MLNKFKYFLSLAVIIALFFACSSDKDKNKQNVDNYKVQEKDTIDIRKDQYRIAENFTGSKNQIIDLIKGPATFDITHQGTGKFVCTLMLADGTVISLLTDVTGDYKGKKQVEVPETRAYILDVKTEGVWSVYRE
jgi:hypothetical protein